MTTETDIFNTCDRCGNRVHAGIVVQARAFGSWESMSRIRGRRVFGTGGDAGPQWPSLHFCDLHCLLNDAGTEDRIRGLS